MQGLVRKILIMSAAVALALSLGACGENGGAVVIGDDCEENEDCDDGEFCDDGECVDIPEDVSCVDDDDCLTSGQECVNGECEYVEQQCGTLGEECVPAAPTVDGAACEDIGRGYRCYATCGTERVCSDGSAAHVNFCNRNEACIDDPALEQPVCQPSECDGYFDTADGCSDLRQQDSESLKDGEHCVLRGNGAYICEGAGEATAGEQCSETSDCAQGLTCVNELAQQEEVIPTRESLGTDSFCAPACDGDEMCDDGQHCIGDDMGVTDGVGFCGDRCEPFGIEESQCDDETACVPVSSEDGLCFRESSKELDLYDSCSSTDECPDNSHCFGDIFTDEGDRCLPLCDPTLSTQEERNATCPGPDGDRVLGGDCLDLTTRIASPLLPDRSEIGTGICFEGCLESEDWGKDGCSGENQACRPEGDGVGWCMDAGDAQQGETCDGDSACDSGLHCDMRGDGEGTCRSYCQPEEETTDTLGCESNEACIQMTGEGFDNIGECRIPCDPGTDGTDPSCPDNQQTCLGSGDQAYCIASGEIAHGEDCGSPLTQNCAPGMVCAKSEQTLGGVLQGPFTDTDVDETATCRRVCDPFVGDLGDSGCPDEYACSPVTPEGASQRAGHCVPKMDTTIATGNSCPEESLGMMCDENSTCISSSPSACGPDQYQCLQFCDYTTGAGCTGGSSCEQGFSGGPLFGWIGLCR